MSRKRSTRRWLMVLLGLIIIIALVMLLIRACTRETPPEPQPPPRTRPTAQSADCPDVEVVVIPGTWESRADDDPYQPHANPRSLMLRVSSALQQRFPANRARVYTIPYMAQFRNPTNLADHQADYDVSRRQGYARTAGHITALNKRCPITTFLVMGFSQGAVIAGDVASIIGNGRGIIDPDDQDLVVGVGLIADGRRVEGQQNNIGPNPPGQGAEVALGPILANRFPGISMNGKRAGGFGTLRDRVQGICAPGDLICDSPTITNPLRAIGQLAGAINNPVHAMYATPRYWEDNGATATQWMFAYAVRTIDAAPHPKHF
ncbi:MAG: cutinase family protein [Gordonia sp. (in: high G+C Gram-positive bacteria)]|uniref:cutinase family protein n=1 Tax=Gordonia sp. (in: high G+C Gram-positive bacteria) TaxID=84139 RepID=UPI0039E47543